MAHKRVAIVQSNYIPWKGYFDLIRAVDEFVLFDDVQYTRRDWRNRNKIKTPQGAAWLTIPVSTKGQYYEPIKSITASDLSWTTRHWQTIAANYARARFFRNYAETIERAYRECVDTHLSAINFRFISTICGILGITTKITWSMDYTLAEGKTERLVSICEQAGADLYLSGPAARDYIDQTLFDAANVRLVYADYTGYPEYTQLFPPFDHYVSALDLIFNEGPEATRYMLSLSTA
jgi:WbqC-like protein family